MIPFVYGVVEVFLTVNFIKIVCFWHLKVKYNVYLQH